MVLRISFEVIGANVLYRARVDVARRDEVFFLKIIQPLGAVKVDLVVIRFGHVVGIPEGLRRAHGGRNVIRCQRKYFWGSPEVGVPKNIPSTVHSVARKTIATQPRRVAITLS